MTKRWLTAAAALVVLLAARPQRAAADMHWIAYYPGAVINFYEGPYPFIWGWQNIHWPSSDTYYTYGIGRGTYKVYYPTADRSGKYYYITPKAGVANLDTTAVIEVKLPASDADVWFEGVRTTRTGSVREFLSPPLVEGRTYTYEVMALWGEGGRDVKQTRRVRIAAGERVAVDFTAPPPPP
jgi:uncharacterized protein (TIGR03000 family)